MKRVSALLAPEGSGERREPFDPEQSYQTPVQRSSRGQCRSVNPILARLLAPPSATVVLEDEEACMPVRRDRREDVPM